MSSFSSKLFSTAYTRNLPLWSALLLNCNYLPSFFFSFLLFWPIISWRVLWYGFLGILRFCCFYNLALSCFLLFFRICNTNKALPGNCFYKVPMEVNTVRVDVWICNQVQEKTGVTLQKHKPLEMHKPYFCFLTACHLFVAQNVCLNCGLSETLRRWRWTCDPSHPV